MAYLPWHSGLLRQFVSYGILVLQILGSSLLGGILLILGWLSLAASWFFEPKPEANSP